MRGKISLTCDNEYDLYINGVHRGTSRNWKKGNKHYKFDIRDRERNEILIRCRNRWGISGLVANIEIGEEVIVSDGSWEVSEDRINWVKAVEVAEYGAKPWGEPIPLDSGTKWIWHNDRRDGQVVWVRKVLGNTIETSAKKEGMQVVEQVSSSVESNDVALIDKWKNFSDIFSGAIAKVSEEQETLKGLEKFITPSDMDVIKKVKELNGDPVACYRYVSDVIRYVSDDINYRKSEYWTYPSETLAKGSGDCEDQAFLIASMFSYLGIECFVRTAYLLNYGSGHAWCYFKWNGEWLAAECTSSSFDPWDVNRRPHYGPYLPWVDIKVGGSHNYTGLELIKHVIRFQMGEYSDGTVKIK